MEIVNRRANFDYFIEEQYETGIELKGTEVKSIRNGECNIKDCYGIIKNEEIYLLNMYIKEYQQGGIFNHEESRTRKLLLHKKEIMKIAQKITINGYTLIPLKVYLKANKVKVLLGVCKGKKVYNKKEAIKEREQKIKIERELKNS